MKVSYKWLQEYLDLTVKPADLAEKIARTSVDINDVYSPSDGLSKLVVGHVESMTAHPDSDHLKLCMVDTGDGEPVQIVCGAPNVEAGKNVIVALPGARIGNNVKIKRGKMRGEISEGMICALQEIGFSEQIAPKAYEDGIWFLPDDAKPGESVYPYLGMDDTIIDTDVTPNRGDMFSMLGNVNDIAAFYGIKPHLKTREIQKFSDVKTADLVNINIPDQTLAPTYTMLAIQNVTVQDSPLWLQIRLWNAGIRPISNVVDVTNYILLKYGQPLHSFDYDKLPGHEISVRHAQAKESFVTLDEQERELDSNDIVVTADNRPVALAGTMGGLETAIDNHTQNVLLEAAIFNPILVRKQARRHDLHSESSSRFERGINPETVEQALNEAAALIADLGNGGVTKEIVIGSKQDIPTKQITLELDRINHVLGTQLSTEQVGQIFDDLQFEYEINQTQIKVTVPARRWDIDIEADLLEEIARIYGYDNIPSTLPAQTQNVGHLSERQKLIRSSRHILEGLGLNQAISYSLTTKEKAQQFAIIEEKTPMMLDYPMSQDHVATRMSLISGLLDDVAYNVARKQMDVSLYEQGRVFLSEQEGSRPVEHEHLAAAVTGQWGAKTWEQTTAEVDFYVLKGIVERYLQNLSLEEPITFQANEERTEMHPGRTADILLNDQVIGYIGEVHPSVAKQLKIPTTYVFELDLEALIAAPKENDHYQEISKYPAINRDIAILVDKSISNSDIVAAIQQKGGAFLQNVHLFDVYTGAHLPAHKKSLAYTLTYQDKQKTLVDDQVNQAFDKVVQYLETQFAAEIR